MGWVTSGPRRRDAPQAGAHLPPHLPRVERSVEPASTQGPSGFGEMDGIRIRSGRSCVRQERPERRRRRGLGVRCQATPWAHLARERCVKGSMTSRSAPRVAARMISRSAAAIRPGRTAPTRGRARGRSTLGQSFAPVAVGHAPWAPKRRCRVPGSEADHAVLPGDGSPAEHRPAPSGAPSPRAGFGGRSRARA